MHRIHSMQFLIVVSVYISAETVHLTGTVSNRNESPISGAIVSLAGLKLADTTDDNGFYSLGSATAAAGFEPGSCIADPISFSNGTVSISLPERTHVNVDLFDLRGNLLRRIQSQSVQTGAYRLDLTCYLPAAATALLHISAGGRTASFFYISLHERGRTVSSGASGPQPKQGSASSAKTRAVSDTIEVTATGYSTRRIAISSYEGNNDIVLDSLALEKFSFFVTSLKALQELSGSQNGFGGDLRFGKTGPGSGLLGADSICRCIAERSMPGSGIKQWRAFLSVAEGPDGKQVNAIDRIGQGPWYDRVGKLLAPALDDLLNDRPANGDPAIRNDLPNEDGIPNHRPDPNEPAVDNHHMITGTGTDGSLYSRNQTCDDWTSVTAKGGAHGGLAWPRIINGREMGTHWISGTICPGCAPGVSIIESGGPGYGSTSIGSGGGYGGFYCFALTP